ncbi:hypothetical protein CT0861_07977, partial [Colletotrichum tofieldiae]
MASLTEVELSGGYPSFEMEISERDHCTDIEKGSISPAKTHLTPPGLATALQVVLSASSADTNLLKTSKSRPPRSEDKHTVSTRSSKVWNLPNTKVWVARETDIPVPTHLLTRWPEIRDDLLIELKEIDLEMLAEQAKKKSRRKQHEKRRRIVPELRMSGNQEHIFSKSVVISPCVWILCGSKSCRNKVRRMTGKLCLPIDFVSQPIEVHDGAPDFYAGHLSIPLTQLEFNAQSNQGLEHQGGTILYHVESPPRNVKQTSACGLICCATLTRGGKVVEQRFSRVGGLLTSKIGNYHQSIPPIAMTTAHGLYDLFSLQGISRKSGTVSMETESMQIDDETDDGEYTSSSDSASDSDSDFDSRMHQGKEKAKKQEVHRLLGERDPALVESWTPLQDVVGVKLFETCLPAKQEQSCTLKPSDYALLRLQTSAVLRNISLSWPMTEVTDFMPNQELISGPVTLLFGQDDMSKAFLLSGTVKMPLLPGFKTLELRRIQLSSTMAAGTSGTWVTRGSSFCGMIVAAYPGQPLALLMTAEDILEDIKVSFPIAPNPPATSRDASPGRSQSILGKDTEMHREQDSSTESPKTSFKNKIEMKKPIAPPAATGSQSTKSGKCSKQSPNQGEKKKKKKNDTQSFKKSNEGGHQNGRVKSHKKENSHVSLKAERGKASVRREVWYC